jgi:deoxyribonuclease V
MQLPRPRHRWTVAPARAVEIQKRLAGEVLHLPLPRPPRLVAGGDAAFTADGQSVIAGWIVWDVRLARVVDQVVACRPVTFPYVPGLLSFREAPALIAAARKLSTEPDVFMLDGQGLAHPRRFGLACHVGLFIGRPTLGCAKSRLCGAPRLDRVSTWSLNAAGFHQPRESRGQSSLHIPQAAIRTLQLSPGSSCPLTDGDELLGCALWTREGAKPVYVSVGHRITLDHAVGVALLCHDRCRLPEPARLAHQYVTRRRELTML